MKVQYFALIVILLLLGSCTNTNTQKLSFSKLKTEYLENPVGVDVLHPRFSWTTQSRQRGVQQSAYQIQVAEDRDKLVEDRATIWNSGKVQHHQSVNISYEGGGLQSDQTYYWRVKTWGADGEESSWSPIQEFHTGLMKKLNWQGSWISAQDTSISAPLLRKKFLLKKEVARATAFVTGVGYYELYLNGRKVGDHVLDPAMTDYHKRVLYATYDVTKQLQNGGNALGIMLGNGVWRMHHIKNRYTRQDRLWGPPCALLQLNIRFKDGTKKQIVTDATWKSSPGPVTYNNFNGGEDYDARREQPGWATSGFNDSTWQKVSEVKAPGGSLKAQMISPIKITKTIKPVKMTHPSKGVYLFDLGQNIAGWWRIHGKGKRGTKLRIHGAETLNDSLFPKALRQDDKLSTKYNYHSQVYTDYTLKGGEKETYEPRFFYTGFRYIKVTMDQPDALDAVNVEGRVVQTALKQTGKFSSSDTLLNKIHNATIWSQVANTHGYPSDCPTREKGAYTGDGQLIAETAMHDFDVAAFFTKWVADMRDAQQENGKVPNTAPTLVGGGGGIAWGSAYILVPWWMHQYYSDTRILKKHYPSMKKYMGYLHHLARNDSTPDEKYIINKFGGFWDSLGEWCAPGQYDGPNHPVASTAYWYEDAITFAHIAQTLGKRKDARRYRALADTIKHAFNKKFLNQKTYLYGTDSPYQTYLVLALAFDLVPQVHRREVVQNLVSDIKQNHDNHLNTGILGTKYLLPVLANSGHADLAYKIATQKTYPSWGYWIEHGATTLWEKWSGQDSHNHQMFGTIDEFLYEYLAGIRPPTDEGTSTGYQKVLIKPFVPDSLERAEASVETMQGKIKSKWIHEGNDLTLEVTLPANTTGKISIPIAGLNHATITERGKEIWRNNSYVDGASGISDGAREGQYISFHIASGRYKFNLSGK